MTKQLNIASGFSLPLDAVTQTFCILAIRGAGKTNAAVVMAEEMLKNQQPIVAYDPTSAWWGLKTLADGKHPGFPVVIFGGQHADVPLEETAGKVIARVIVERRISAILDTSLLRKGARVRLMTEFCEELFHLNREPLHLFLDEAHTICPQRVMPDTARLVGAIQDIQTQGRLKGLGTTAISQRPALLNTDIRSLAETPIFMRILGPHDRKAVKEWTDAHGTPEEAAEMWRTLSTLKLGEAWIWSPQWLDRFERIKFRKRETFDSSATPEVGKKLIAPTAFAEVDLKALGEEIVATVERVKADDPKALRAKVAELERKLETASAGATPQELDTERDLGYQEGFADGRSATEETIRQAIKARDQQWRELVDIYQKDSMRQIEKLEQGFRDLADTPLMPPEVADATEVTHVTSAPPPRSPEPRTAPQRQPQPRPNGSATGSAASELSGGAKKLVGALLAYPNGLTRGQAKIMCGFADRTLTNYVSELNVSGVLLKESGRLRLSPDRIAELQRSIGSEFAPPRNTREVLEIWSPRLSGGADKLLRLLIARRAPIARSEAMRECGFAERTLTNYVSEVSVAGLLIRGAGTISANKGALFL